MSYKMLQVSDEIIFHTEGLDATILVDGEEYVKLGRDDLGAISEWLAAAWENVAGEEYKPVVISEGGYVTDRGVEVVAVVRPGEHVIPKAYLSMPGLDSLENLERDCE